MAEEFGIIVNLVIFITVLGAIGLAFAAYYSFITVTDLAWFTGGTVAVAGACVVATGLPCAAAIAIYALVTGVLTYFQTTLSLLTTIILTPISIILILYILRVARGH